MGSYAPDQVLAANDSDRTLTTTASDDHDEAADGDDEERRAFRNAKGNSDKIVPPKWIGNIRCFWHNEEGIPRITIGPNWGFTIFLLGLVCVVFYVSCSGMVNLYKASAPWYYQVIGLLVIVLGLSSFFLTLFSDPGIPREVYKMYARPYAKKSTLPEVN